MGIWTMTQWRSVLAVGRVCLRNLQEYLEYLLDFSVDGSGSGFAFGQHIIEYGSVADAVAAIANAFSMYLMSSTPNATRPYGDALSPEVYVVVRWPWLVFPGLLTVLGTLFLGTSLWISRSDRTTFLWKSSLVPLLFHGLSRWHKDELDASDKMEMDEQAKRMEAKLERDGDGSLKSARG
ncbi:hypothetical protein MPH_10232 [Macrophomina phaseolina MS6]|uniref:Uncharacterized protein n=1 Tax=Macrophomina phaseolina (strain MS6) TaxID=1126212 RepID=K2RDK1_MACPH|nr:hypothetical protein MPH_10232 [Macrophomina phaseolina MS6]